MPFVLVSDLKCVFGLSVVLWYNRNARKQWNIIIKSAPWDVVKWIHLKNSHLFHGSEIRAHNTRHGTKQTDWISLVNWVDLFFLAKKKRVYGKHFLSCDFILVHLRIIGLHIFHCDRSMSSIFLKCVVLCLVWKKKETVDTKSLVEFFLA